MKAYPEHASVPPELPLKGASCYSSCGLLRNVNVGTRGGQEYFVFEYDSNTGEAESPKTPTTSLSRTSGLQLERVGEWIFAFEPERRVDSDEIDSLIDNVLKLLEYAKTFPQNL
jgi:hypothetical protein